MQASETYVIEIEELKKEVKYMLQATTNNVAEKINLIDTLERIGVSYHFKKEIQQQLDQIFNSTMDFEDERKWDLCTIAQQFRIFRQHGYDVSSGKLPEFSSIKFT
jgi:hypothetical protein